MGIPASSQQPNESEQRQQVACWQGGPRGILAAADRTVRARWRSLLARGQGRCVVDHGGFPRYPAQILTYRWLLLKLMLLPSGTELWSPTARLAA